MSEYVCTSCSSENIQRLSVIYQGGISDINTKSSGTGIGFGRGGIGIGFGRKRTKGTSQTAASLRAAPPPKKAFLKPLAGIFVCAFILMLFAEGTKFLVALVYLLWAGGSVAWVVFAINYNKKTWPPLMRVWENSYLCNRCNNIFTMTS